MYCIVRAGLPESHDAHAFHCLVKPYGLPPLNINTKAPVSMQYILKKNCYHFKQPIRSVFFFNVIAYFSVLSGRNRYISL